MLAWIGLKMLQYNKQIHKVMSYRVLIPQHAFADKSSACKTVFLYTLSDHMTKQFKNFDLLKPSLHFLSYSSTLVKLPLRYYS